MQLVQWIVPKKAGGFAVLHAPAWAETLPPHGAHKKRLRRRSGPVTSRWLPHPIAVAVEDGAAQLEGRATTAALSLAFTFAASDRGPPVLPMRDDDVSYASLFAEMMRVVADLCEACSLPALSLHPGVERRGMDVALGSVGNASAQTLLDALCTLHVAVDQCAQARGFLVSDARVVMHEKKRDASAPMDARAADLVEGDA
jgi:hypothetical protein